MPRVERLESFLIANTAKLEQEKGELAAEREKLKRQHDDFVLQMKTIIGM